VKIPLSCLNYFHRWLGKIRTRSGKVDVQVCKRIQITQTAVDGKPKSQAGKDGKKKDHEGRAQCGQLQTEAGIDLGPGHCETGCGA
jgi:hypothetical protein